MNKYQLTASATQDVLEIWRYIAVDSVEAANRVEEAIYDACRFLARSPHAGQRRPGLTIRPLRFWTLSRFRNYVVVYDPEPLPLRIIRILHVARNIPPLLQDVQ